MHLNRHVKRLFLFVGYIVIIAFVSSLALVVNNTWSLPELHIYLDDGATKMGIIFLATFLISILTFWLLDNTTQDMKERPSNIVLALLPIMAIVALNSILTVDVILAWFVWRVCNDIICKPLDAASQPVFRRLNDEVVTTAGPSHRVHVDSFTVEEDEDKRS